MGKKIFISYRRADAQMTAGRLHDDLVRRFSSANVFRDKEAIRPGFDWVEEIQQALNEGVVVLALIGPQWAGSRDSQGRRRLDDPEDPNRVELETALARNAPLIPVLVEGATIPAADDLPASLRPLARRNAIRLRDDDWDADLARLADAVSSLGVVSAASSVGETRRQTPTLKTALWAGIGLLAIVVLGGALWLYTTTRELANLSGKWTVTQENKNGSRNEGTLTLRMEGLTLLGELAWEGLDPADVIDARLIEEELKFTARYPNKLEGKYTARIGDSGTSLLNGHTESGKDSATWSGRRLEGRGRGD